MYQRILVPIDGSGTAERGLSEAIMLAADQKANLRVVYVFSDAYLNPPLMQGSYAGDPVQQIRTQAEAILNAALATATGAGVGAETRLLEHHSYQIGEAIIKEAGRWQADLIVMGTHGRRGLTRALMGSDAEYVLRHTPVPVLLLRAAHAHAPSGRAEP